MSVPKLHPFSIFPAASDRDRWLEVAQNPRLAAFRADIAALAAQAMTEPVPYLSPIRYMDFVRNGNRGLYEADYFARRRRLEALVISEALEYKGKYLERIVEYLDAILSEYTWCLPAHAGLVVDPLPWFYLEYIDLFSAETASYLTQTLVLLEKELKSLSPNFVRRIREEILKRAILPIEAGIARFGWHKGSHNWTVWIVSNLMWIANTMLADDPDRFTHFAAILEGSVSEYVKYYSEDGGCDEGCGYWNLSPTRYFLFEEALRLASDGAYKSPIPEKLKKMCQFISDCWQGGDTFTQFGDGGARGEIHYGLIRAMARRTGCTKTMDFINRFEQSVGMKAMKQTGFVCTLVSLFTPVEDVPPVGDFISVYPVLHQVYSRHGQFYTAIKGGTNGEGHNHNDVGEFVFVKDGVPVIVDPGSMQYCKDTFNSNRYKQWTMNAIGHNALLFNGIGEHQGGNFHDEDFTCTGTPEHFTVAMELAGCYFQEEIAVISYRRTLEYKDEALAVHDQWETKEPVVATMNLYHIQPTIPLSSDAPASTEHVDTSDPSLAARWGNSLYRTTLTSPRATSGSMNIVLKP